MAERAAHLVDHVFPDVPVRQWVLSLPHRLRYQLAWRHDVCRAVVGIFMAAVLRRLRDQAHNEGVADGRGGRVAIIQRFGGALNLNVHIHALVMDGVFATDRHGRQSFHPAAAITHLDVAEVLATVAARVGSLLERHGLGDDDDREAWEDVPVLGGFAAASVQGTLALAETRGRRVKRLGSRVEQGEPPTLGPPGFSAMFTTTEPDPAPVVGPSITIYGCVLDALHTQPSWVVTVNVILPPTAPILASAGLST